MRVGAGGAARDVDGVVHVGLRAQRRRRELQRTECQQQLENFGLNRVQTLVVKAAAKAGDDALDTVKSSPCGGDAADGAGEEIAAGVALVAQLLL